MKAIVAVMTAIVAVMTKKNTGDSKKLLSPFLILTKIYCFVTNYYIQVMLLPMLIL